jgi:hypothetical protein
VLTAVKALAGIFPNSKSLALLTGAPALEEKSIEAIASLADVERYLRDVGMSHTKAKAMLSRIKSLGQRDADEGKSAAAIAAMEQISNRIYR